MLMDQNIWMFVGIIFQLLGNPRPKNHEGLPRWEHSTTKSNGHPLRVGRRSAFQPVEKTNALLMISGESHVIMTSFDKLCFFATWDL